LTQGAQHQPSIRWGILGTGGMARVFTEDLLTLPGHQVAAVGSRSLASATAFADRYRIGRTHGSYQDLAADDRVDVVYVATLQSHHLATAGLCLAAGRAVLVEKPFTMTAAEAEELVAMAARSRVFAMEAMWMRFNPVIAAALRLVHDGEIGEVLQVSADFSIDVRAKPDHRLWRPELGGGALLDLGVYPVTLAHLLLGEPDRVAASSVLAASGVDAETTVRLDYPAGATASLHCGLLAETPQVARIGGTLGNIEIDVPFLCPPGLTLTRRHGAPARIALPCRGHGYTHQAIEVADCLHAGAAQSVLRPLSDTVAVMRLLDRVRAVATTTTTPGPAPSGNG
jgi:predicted dehydrogenase